MKTAILSWKIFIYAFCSFFLFFPLLPESFQQPKHKTKNEHKYNPIAYIQHKSFVCIIVWSFVGFFYLLFHNKRECLCVCQWLCFFVSWSNLKFVAFCKLQRFISVVVVLCCCLSREKLKENFISLLVLEAR